jgi:hypothetical protein
MARNIVRLAIFLLAAHALYRFVPVYVRHQQFTDAVNQVALFSTRNTPDVEISARVVELAGEYGVPLDGDSVQVRRDQGKLHIEAAYVQAIEWLPGYRRPWRFELNAEAVDVR